MCRRKQMRYVDDDGDDDVEYDNVQWLNAQMDGWQFGGYEGQMY